MNRDNQPDKKYAYIIFSVNPSSRNSARLKERWSMFLMEAPIEHPIHESSLGLKLQEAKPI